MDEIKQSEQQQFLKDLDEQPKTAFDAPAEEKTEEVAEPAEDAEMKLKNRRERRLADKLQSEREANIALNARLQALSEVKKFTAEVEDPLKSVEAIFGTDTPEKREATEILKKALEGMSAKAKQEALEEIETRQTRDSKAVEEEEKNLEEILETVEDEHGIDMSNESDRQGFLTLLEKISPKDRDGNIIEYADPDTTAELYLERKGKSNSRAKELADRSMTRSGASQTSKLEEDATWRALREAGIF